MAVYQLDEHAPQLGADAWVAETATVIGRVVLGDGASVWYGAVLRGDNEWIRIGRRSNVQDGCVLHADLGLPLTLGDEVTVGHQAMLHGCSIGDGTLVGIQAVVLNRARIGRGCVVGAGAVIPEGKEYPDHTLILGAPARVVRSFAPAEQGRFAHSAAQYVALAQRHRGALRRIG